MESDVESHCLFEPNVSLDATEYGFGMFTFRRLRQILGIIFAKRISVIFLTLICLMALLEQYLIYNIGIIPSGFYTALGDKNWKGFWLQVLKSTLLILAICFVLSCKKYITNVFYVMSREILTDKIHIFYFNCNKFYYLNNFKYSFTDNPDQRITQDIDKFCQQFSSVLSPFVVAPFTICYYSYNCYVTTGFIGPCSVFVVFILSVLLNKFLMKPIVSKVIQQEKCEGFFRFKHMHVRTNAESIAFQDANIAELSRTDEKLFNLITTQQSLYLREFPLDLAVNIFSYVGSIISYLILAYPIFSGLYSDLTSVELSSLISKNAFVTIYLISCFSSIINVSSTISEIGGLTHRICEILDVLKVDNFYKDKQQNRSSRFKLKSCEQSGDSEDLAIELKDVTFCPPKETKPLVSNISLQLRVGSSLLVTGKSSSGKTSLFRIIKGLWPVQTGCIIRRLPFAPSQMFFLPQHPLLSDGTLLEQIVYPLSLPKFLKPKEVDVDLILSYLTLAELEHILEKAGLNSEVDWNWYDVLSPGEMQRLSFVRLFYHRPKLAFLDEATSALGLELEQILYKKCKDLDITVISIGHRTSLIQFHDNILHLDGEGGWTLTPAHENALICEENGT